MHPNITGIAALTEQNFIEFKFFEGTAKAKDFGFFMLSLL